MNSTGRFDVTVVVPARNEECTIGSVIESLLAQTLAPKEIIIVDGGSYDRTKEIIRSFVKDGGPVQLIEHADAYPGRARNIGIAAASSDWIALTDAGTVIPEHWLESMVKSLRDDTDVVLGSYEPVLNSTFHKYLAMVFLAIPTAMEGGAIRGPSTASMMLRKTVWQKLGGFREDLRACEDLLFFAKLAETDFVIRAAPDAVVRWNVPGDLQTVFRRFRLYSFHTIRAGLWRTWHLPVARMYAVALAISALAVLHHWVWLLLLMIGLLARTHRNINARKSALSEPGKPRLVVYPAVSLMMLWIDMAALIGTLEFIGGKLFVKEAGPHRATQPGSEINSVAGNAVEHSEPLI